MLFVGSQLREGLPSNYLPTISMYVIVTDRSDGQTINTALRAVKMWGVPCYRGGLASL